MSNKRMQIGFMTGVLWALSAGALAQDDVRDVEPAVEEDARAERLAEEERVRAEEERARAERQEELERARAEQAAEQEDVRREQAARAQEQLRQTQRSLEERERELVRARTELEEAARNVARLSALPGTAPTVRPADGLRAMIGITLANAERGALVTSVAPNGPAAEAGIETGDIVVSIGDESLVDGEDAPSERLVTHMRAVEPGDTVTLVVSRDGEERRIDVEARANESFFYRFGNAFDVRVPEVAVSVPPVRVGVAGTAGNDKWVRLFTPFASPWREIELVELTEGLGRYFGASEGLLVVRAPANEAIGLEDGDVILAIGTRTPSSPEHAMRILASFEAGETVALTIMREQTQRTIEYTIPD